MKWRRDSDLGLGVRMARVGRPGGLVRPFGAIASVALVVLLTLPGAALANPAMRKASSDSPFRSLRIGVWGLQIVTLNPLKITLTDEFVVTYSVYSTLTRYDKNFHVWGDLAYNWSVAADSKTWTFHLVPGATFIDPTTPSGTTHPVTADDVVFSYNLQISLNGSVEHEYVQGISSVTKIDAHTVQIVTSQPYAPMLTATSSVPILPSYIWTGVANPLSYPNSDPVGSGSLYYDLTNTSTSTLILRRNANFYGEAFYCSPSRPDEIRFINFPQSSTMVSDFLSGATGLDVIERVAASDYLSGLANWPLKWAVDNGFVGEFSINVMTPSIRQAHAQFQTGSNSPLLLNATVRKAIAMSINKTALVDDTLLNLGTVADSLVPGSNPWHYPIPAADLIPFNPVQARALLNAAGWKYDLNGNLNLAASPLYQVGATNPLVFRFVTLNTASDWQLAAADIRGWLAQSGIETTDQLGNPGYSLYSVGQMNSLWFSGNYDLWLWDWIFSPGSDISLDILSVETTMAIGSLSDNFYSNATYDSLYNQSLVTLDSATRRGITDQMQQMVYSYASYIMPYYRDEFYAARVGRVGQPNVGWGGWGNWSQDVGLAPDSAASALWDQLVPLDNLPPWISSVPVAQGLVGSGTMLSVGATDSEGAGLTYTWTLGDGTANVTTTTPWVLHTYASAGVYSFDVRVSDGEWSICGSAKATISPSATGNLPSDLSAVQFRLSRVNGTSGMPYDTIGRPIPFNVTVADPEGDPVSLVWTFGDGTTGTDSVTNTATPLVVARSHAYAVSGTYRVVVVATDGKTGAGNHTVTVVSGPVEIAAMDVPVTVLSASGTPGFVGWFRSAVTVTLQAWDNATAVARTSYRLDGGPWVNYSVPFIVSGEGNHTVEYYSTNTAGTPEAIESATVHIDTTPPTVTASIAGTVGNAGWYTSSVSLSLVGHDAGSGLAAISYLINNGTPQLYTAPVRLSDGNYTIRYLSIDFAGNFGALGTVVVRVDSVAPSLTLQASGGIVTTQTVAITWIGADNGSGVAEYEVSVDGGPFQSVGLDTSKSLSLSDGPHTVQVRAVDAAGNSVTRNVSFRVDTNIFSITGPYAGAPTYGLIAITVALVLAFLWRSRRRKSAPPPLQETSSVPPPPAP